VLPPDGQQRRPRTRGGLLRWPRGVRQAWVPPAWSGSHWPL
jgi:hypothetical protein